MLSLLKSSRNQDDPMSVTAATGALRPITENPAFAAASARVSEIRRRIAELDAEIRGLQAEEYYFGGTLGADAAEADRRAAHIIAGGEVDVENRPEKIARLERNKQTLVRGCGPRSEEMARIKSRLSAEACHAVRDRHEAALVEVLRAARVLAAAAGAEAAIRREVHDLGYEPYDHILPVPRFNFLSGLDETWYDSALSYFRRQLVSLGIIER